LADSKVINSRFLAQVDVMELADDELGVDAWQTTSVMSRA
jgi:hypothetical protein